jgi:hypothetical protein
MSKTKGLSVTGMATDREQPHTVSLVSGEAQWCERGSCLDATVPRAELQGSPIGL